MAAKREPVRSEYDAELLLWPFAGPARDVYAVIKETFLITDVGPRRTVPRALLHDIRDGDLWPPGSDFWPHKPLVDVVVDGFAYGREGEPFHQRRIAVEVGGRRKEGLAYGRRLARLGTDERWTFERVEPVDRVPLVPEMAYGGIDVAVPSPTPRDLRELADAIADHPGAYPRNRFGMGFVGAERPVGSIVELPMLEDPSDALTEHRFGLAREMADWYRRPLPWFLHWMMPYDFPRSWFVGARPRHPIPADELLEEVRRKWLVEDWRAVVPASPAQPPVPPAYYQEASHFMRFAELPPGTPIRMGGMHPERDLLEVVVPASPEVEIGFQGSFERVGVRPLHLVLRPHELELDVTWVASHVGLPRSFIPGVHGHIPLELRVNGDAPISYPTPTPFRDAVDRSIQATFGLNRAPGQSLLSMLRHVGGLSALPTPTTQESRRLQVGSVDVVSGAVRLRETDRLIDGPMPFSLDRTYDSRHTREGLLGAGWSCTLDQAVRDSDGHLVFRDADGAEWRLRRDEGSSRPLYRCPGFDGAVRHDAGGTFVLHRADGSGTRFQRDAGAEALPSELFDGAGGRLGVGYDALGRLHRLTRGGEPVLRFEVGDDGRLHRVFAVAGEAAGPVLLAHYEYDARGRLRAAGDSLGMSSYDYDADRMVQHKRRGGRRTRLRYSAPGATSRCVGEDWIEGHREVEATGSAVSVVDALGHGFVVELTNGRVSRALDPFAQETCWDIDEASGLPTAMTTPDGETTYLYDASYHLADVTAPDAGSVALEHDAEGRLTSLRDADGHEETAHWDGHGRLAARTDRAGAGVVYDYDGEGPLSGLLTPAEVKVLVERDATGKGITAVRSPLGDRRATRDALGRVATLHDELGFERRFRYDPRGYVKEDRRPEDVRVLAGYDAAGKVIGWSDGATTRTLERDEVGRLVFVDEGGGEGMRLHRDAEGRVTMVESEGYDYWELHRDAAGRVQEESGFGGEAVLLLRDHAGRVRRSSAGRVRASVTRDRAGRPVAVEHGDETFQRFAWTPGGKLARAQDADRITTFARDGEGRLLEERSGDRALTSRYDANGMRVALDSSLGLSLRVERDALGRAVKLTATQGAQRLELSFGRDAAGRERRRQLPGGLELRFGRDELGRVIRRAVCFGERELSVLDFAWAGLDRLTKVQDSQRGLRAHTHDPRGRLVRVGALDRALDAVGRVFRNAERDDHTYEGARLVEAYGNRYAYDDAGRRTSRTTVMDETTRYVWDGAGRLVRVELPGGDRVTYDYDGLGRLVGRRRESEVEIPGVEQPVWEATCETELVWDGLAILHEVEGAKVTTWVREAGRLVGKLTTDGAFAVLTDPLGVVTELTDVSGNLAWRGSVDLFGAVAVDAATTACPWRYPGHWEDPDLGLAFSWLRVYDPETGGYLTPNPLGVIAGSDLYGYLADPLSETSPLGLARGYATLGGEVASERLEAELIARFVEALDRGDGAAGPRARFDRAAARFRMADPEAELFGPFEALRPSRRMPPRSAIHTALPKHIGLAADDDDMAGELA